jgi:hypothetical protein
VRRRHTHRQNDRQINRLPEGIAGIAGNAGIAGIEGIDGMDVVRDEGEK